MLLSSARRRRLNHYGPHPGLTPIPFVDLGAAYSEVAEELEEAVLRVCRSGRYVGGRELELFEQEFAAALSVRHALGVANGTDALELALRGLDIGPGDEVLVPANTFVATAEAVCAAGARPRFVDVDADSGLIDLVTAESRVTAATRAVIPVHLYGRMVDVDVVLAFASRHGLAVIEDAAHAVGARRDGRSAGTIGAAGCFSFYPSKNLGALGDAGMVVTDDDALAERVRQLGNHGRAGHDRHVAVGRNSRLDPIQAAVLRVKLRHLEDWTSARRRLAGELRSRLDGSLLDWLPPPDAPETEVHHLFPVLTDERDELIAYLTAARIESGIHYPSTVPDTGIFGESEDDCPAARSRARRQLSLPFYPHLRPAELDRIVGALDEFLAR